MICEDLAIIPVMLIVPLPAGNSPTFDFSKVPYGPARIALIFLVIVVPGYLKK